MPDSSASPLLEMRDVDKSFPGVKALDRARLTVRPGRVMALVGENGAGKSTLMKVLTGIYSMDTGSLAYLGRQTRFASPRDSQAAGISIIHQELNLIPELTIAENIFLGREPVGLLGRIRWSRMHDAAEALLRRLGVNHDPGERLGELSIGEQQMVEIAKALSFESRVIVMDEPTDALTDSETASLFKVINELRADGHGIVYISHRLKEIFEICDDVTVMRDGQFVGERPVSELTEDELIEMMVGRKLEEQYPRIPPQTGTVSLAVRGLSGPGVRDVSFELHRGEILGVSGLMGSGRTELMRILYGARQRSAGEVLLDGRPLRARSPQQALRAGIAYISEDRKGDGLVLQLSVKENMSLAALDRLTNRLGAIKHQFERTAVADFISAFNIKTPGQDQMISNLSGGNQQKVAIAKGLMTKPRVLILDEPTRGVDVGAKKEIYELINRFKAEGMSIVLVSSEMPEVLGISDRIMVMHEGRITGEFPADEADQEKLMACAVGKSPEELLI